MAKGKKARVLEDQVPEQEDNGHENHSQPSSVEKSLYEVSEFSLKFLQFVRISF